ncbi:LOW QUALITY PROTEIN: uncharacterized protein LOC131952901, partial [Physella acuta]|uniref:LOW QUALITY PROTEIN: uncharacterized protein LOC131952901 n=1 Tax=Physella acuta TaxID=109671 RepID=UPI0027DDA2B7
VYHMWQATQQLVHMSPYIAPSYNYPLCSRCTTCGKRLNNWYIQNHGDLYCRKDYWTRFGDRCNGCSQVTSGPVMVAGEHKYHPECFLCCVCQGLIGDGEPYALLERSYLYCGHCYKAVPSPVAKTPRRKPHSIQMVEIPPPQTTKPQQHHEQQRQEQQRTFHLALQTTPFESGTLGVGLRNSMFLENGRLPPCVQISELDASPQLNGLAVGDRILEVDGTAVRDKTLEEISSLLTNHQKPVHVMVERDLSPLRFAPEEELPGFQLNKSLSRTSLDDSSSSAASDNETVLIQGTPVILRHKGSLRAKGHSPSRRRSKSPSPCPTARQKSVDLNRSHSFSTRQQEHRVFRAVDLILGEILGQGFFGQAIKAVHRVTGEKMVLKELHNFDEDAQKSFLREVSMLRNLSHPCVLKFMGVLYRDKKLNLVTEFIDGGTLSDLLLDHSVELSWKQRVAFAKDIAAGMSYLHSMDIIHRDLNSQNCLVRKDLHVVVADFGLAKIFPRHENLQLHTEKDSKLAGKKKRFSRRKRQTVVGNPYWMAPEMMTKGVYDEKVDVFSFGIIVCETIARVTADPDYLPRSIDFGLNVEAFHKRFCANSPEPYFMLAVLCSQIEPDQRPSFEKVHVLCEALHLHVEHGMAAPSELQGSTVELYYSLKEKMYGKDFKDVDSCTQAVKVVEVDTNSNQVKEVKVKKMLSQPGSECLPTVREEGEMVPREGDNPSQQGGNSAEKGGNSSQEGGNSAKMGDNFERLNSNGRDDCGDVSEQCSRVPATKVAEQNTRAVDGITDKAHLEVDDGTGEASTTAVCTSEDHAYFSCSSISPSLSPSSPCLSPEEFTSCKSSPLSSGDSVLDYAALHSNSESRGTYPDCSVDVPDIGTKSELVPETNVSELVLETKVSEPPPPTSRSEVVQHTDSLMKQHVPVCPSDHGASTPNLCSPDLSVKRDAPAHPCQTGQPTTSPTRNHQTMQLEYGAVIASPPHLVPVLQTRTDSPQSTSTNMNLPESQGSNLDLLTNLLSNLDLSISQESNFDLSTNQGSNLDISQSQGSNFDLSTNQGSNLDISKSQGSNFDLSTNQGSNLDISKSKGSTFDLSTNQVSNLDLSTSQGSNFDLSASQGSNLDISTSQGSNFEIQAEGDSNQNSTNPTITLSAWDHDCHQTSGAACSCLGFVPATNVPNKDGHGQTDLNLVPVAQSGVNQTGLCNGKTGPDVLLSPGQDKLTPVCNGGDLSPPVLLSPGHERGLSSSRRRLRRSLKRLEQL